MVRDEGERVGERKERKMAMEVDGEGVMVRLERGVEKKRKEGKVGEMRDEEKKIVRGRERGEREKRYARGREERRRRER